MPQLLSDRLTSKVSQLEMEGLDGFGSDVTPTQHRLR